MPFGDIFRDRELLVCVDNAPALSAAVHDYRHAPEMAFLSHALHLLFAGLSAAPRFLHVPGKANPAGIPSRVPFVRRDGSHALDPDRLRPAAARVVAALRACYRPMALPTAAQLGTREYLFVVVLVSPCVFPSSLHKVTPSFESCTPSFTYRGPVSWLRAGRALLPHGARLADPCV